MVPCINLCNSLDRLDRLDLQSHDQNLFYVQMFDEYLDQSLDHEAHLPHRHYLRRTSNCC